MTIFYRWTEKNSPDIPNFKTRKLTYTYGGTSSSKAFWVFESSSEYRPGAGIMKDRILLAFDFGNMDTTVIKNQENWIDFESEDFKGETRHPAQIIIKSNERGAYGIGALVRGFLTVSAIRLATKKEVADALGLSQMEVKSNQTW
jgi:hypothetical protein